MLLNFCALGERLRHRRAQRRQRRALHEAQLAGWGQKKTDDDEKNQDDDDDSADLENEHHHWHTTPEEAAIQQHFPAENNNHDKKKSKRTKKNQSKTSKVLPSSATTTTTPASFAGGRLKLFTPEFFEFSVDGTPPRRRHQRHQRHQRRGMGISSPESATADMSHVIDDDDDHSSSSSNDVDDVRSENSSSSNSQSSSDDSMEDILPENAPESALSPSVNAMLERLQQLHQHRGMTPNRLEASTEETTTSSTTFTEDTTTTTTTFMDDRPQEEENNTTTTLREVPPKEKKAKANDPEHGSSDDDDDESLSQGSDASSDDDDDDSVDYGGAETSVWQGVGQSFLSTASSMVASLANTVIGGSGATTNSEDDAVVTSQATNPPNPHITSAKSLVTSTDLLAMENYLHDDDDDAVMNHQGAEVFLYTENKNKYHTIVTHDAAGAAVSAITTTNKLFDITEAKPPQDQLTMTETEKVLQEATAEQEQWQRHYQDELDFAPRLDDDDDEGGGIWQEKDLTFTPGGGGGTFHSPNGKNINSSNLKLSEILLSPDTNNSNDTKSVVSSSRQSQRDNNNLMSPLSAMVHPINLELFDNDDLGRLVDESFTSSLATVDHNNPNSDNWSVSSCPVSRRLSDMIPSSSDRSVSSSRTSASFRSSSMVGGRVLYSLSLGKRSMSKAQRQYSKDFLPKSLLVDLPESSSMTTKTGQEKSNRPSRNNNSTLSVLLVDVQQHIFEVIAVDCYYKDDCTVGDVLSKARASATDPALSEQKYISLVYGDQEFAAPMLKIHAAVDFNIAVRENNKTNRPLALAVPEGSNARQVQCIKTILWRNPKMKRWWNVDDPFQPPVNRMDSITEISVPLSPKASSSASNSSRKTTKDYDRLLKDQMVAPAVSTDDTDKYDDAHGNGDNVNESVQVTSSVAVVDGVVASSLSNLLGGRLEL